MSTSPRILAHALLVAALVGAACLPPTNPYDPETPRLEQAKASVQGVVSDDAEAALAGATIELMPRAADGSLSTPLLTADDGKYAFRELVPGPYDLRVSHPAYAAITLPLTLLPGEAKGQDVTLGGGDGLLAHLTGIAHKGAQLARAEDAQDHSGIIVEVTGTDIRTVTNRRGAFAFTLVPSAYSLTLTATDHAERTVDVGALVPGENPLADVIVLDAEPGTLSGTLALEDGLPPADIVVTVVGPGDTTSTAADGSFQFSTLPSGVFTVTAAKAGYATRVFPGVAVVAGDSAVLGQGVEVLARARGSVAGVVTLAGRSDASGVAVSLTGTDAAAITGEAGSFRLDGVPTGTYELTALRDGFQKGVVSPVVVLEGAVAPVALQLAPRVGDFEINGGTPFTQVRDVTLGLDPEAGVTDYMASEDPTFADAARGDVAFHALPEGGADAAFTLTAADGTKVVFVKFRDGDGITSGPFQASIILDTAPPAPPLGEEGLRINGDAPFSNSAAGVVTLAMRAVDGITGVAAVQIDTAADFATSAFQPFTVSTVFTLADPLNDGVRDVYVRFQDGAGNISPALHKSIVLDRTPPTIASVQLNGGAAFTRSVPASVSISATDALSGVTQMALSTDVAFPTEVFGAFATPQSFFLSPGDGTRSVFVKVMDGAGNKTNAASDSITVDTTPPTGASVTINAGASATNNAVVTLALAATGATKMLLSLTGDFGDVDTALNTAPAFAASTAVTLAGQGPQGVYVLFADDAKNVTGVASDTITVDTSAPSTPVVTIAEAAGAFVASPGVTVGINGSGATKMKLAVAEGDCVTDPPATDFAAVADESFVRARAVALPANNAATNSQPAPADRCKTVRIQLFDDAGNTSGVGEATVQLDSQPPDAPRIDAAAVAAVIDDDNDGAADFAVPLLVDAVDHNLDRYEVRLGGPSFVPVSTFADASCVTGAGLCTVLVTLNQTNGADTPNRIEVRAVDAAGNPSLADVVQVREDSTTPGALTNVVAAPSDEEVAIRFSAGTPGADGTLLGYLPKTNTSACPTSWASYQTSTVANEGPSPIDLGAARTFRLTGLSNNVPTCLALVPYETAHGPPATATVVEVTPSEVGLQRIARITAAQLGIGASHTRALALRDGTLYVATNAPGFGLIELDVTNEGCFTAVPALNAAQFAACTNLKASGTNTDPRQMVLHGQFAFIADGSAGVRIYKLAEGTAPTEVAGASPLANAGGGAEAAKIALSVAVSGDLLAVGRSASRVRDFNGRVDLYFTDSLYAAAPAAPGFISTVAQSTAFGDPGSGIFGCNAVDLENFVMAVGSRLYNASIFGISEFTRQPALGNGVGRIMGRYMVSVNDDNGQDNDFRVVDIGAPGGASDPYPVVSNAFGIASHDVEVVGPYALVAGRHTLDIVDLSDRNTARFIGTYVGTAGPVGGDVGFTAEVLFGDVTAEGNRAFFTSGNVGEIDVLRFGDASRLEAVASVEDPLGSFDAAWLDDAWVQGRHSSVKGAAPEAVVHAGKLAPVLDGASTPTLNANGVDTEHEVTAFFNAGNPGTVEFAYRNTTGAIGGHSFVNLPASTEALGGVVRWPWLIAATKTGTNLSLRVFDMRPIFTGPSLVAATTVATLGSDTWRTGPAAAVLHGGFVYVAGAQSAFGSGIVDAAQGLYRATFNPFTGAVGAFTKVENGPVVGVMAAGRRVWFVRNNGGSPFVTAGTFAQTLTDPATWTSANVVQVSSRYAQVHRLTVSGPYLFIPQDTGGLTLSEVRYDAATFKPNAVTDLVTITPGGIAHRALWALDRVYLQQFTTSGLVFRTR